MTAVLYARRRVTLPAFAAAVYNGGIILAAVLLHDVLDVYALVVGVVVGAAGQILLQAPDPGSLALPAASLNSGGPRSARSCASMYRWPSA